MRITSKGQVTIPHELREEFGFLPNTEVEFEVQANKLVLLKRKKRSVRGQDLIAKMAGKATTMMSTDEIMRLTRSS